MDLLHGLDLLSTFVFALVGARVAADKRLDYGGIAFIAIIASVSGGTLRNVFLGLKPIWITDPSIIASIILAVLITLVFRRVTRIGKTLIVMDTFGLAIATISGTQLAFEQNISWYGAILLGLVTAVAGGLLRDVLCQLEPVLLHRETIGTSCLIGSIAYVLLDFSSLNAVTISILAGITVFAVRGLSIYFDINLPKIRN